jgi:hypothetical protein
VISVTPGRKTLEQLIGKTVCAISHTDMAELLRTDHLDVYLLFDDGSVFTAGTDGFRVYLPGEYHNQDIPQ